MRGGIREFVSFINENKTPVHDQVVYMAGGEGRRHGRGGASVHRRLQRDHRLLRQQHPYPPEGGMHEEGFKRAITTVLNSYGRKMKLLKEDERCPATTAGRV